VKSVLVVAATTGYQIRSFGQAARKLGLRLLFASDRCDQLDDPWWDKAIPVRFHAVAQSTAALIESLAGASPDGVVAVGDRPAVLAAHLAQALGLPGNPPAAADASRNKLAAREALRAAGLPTPWFRQVPLDIEPEALTDVPYPAVIKPLALSGSRGVMRVNGPGELGTALSRLRALLASPDVRLERDAVHDRAMIESFIPGREFAVEALLTHGRFQLLAIFDKPDPMDGPFFEETIYVTPSRLPAGSQDRIAAAIAAAAAALGLRHGPLHAECRVNGAGVYVLEVAARPIGGLCSKALRFVQGTGAVSLEEVLLRHALGEDVSDYRRDPDASGVMMIPIPRRGIFRGVEGADAAAAVPGVESVEITAKRGTTLVPLPEGRSYLGFIFARAPEPEQLEQALRAAHAKLRFSIDREVPLAL
jgi:biotin carboxylase